MVPPFDICIWHPREQQPLKKRFPCPLHWKKSAANPGATGNQQVLPGLKQGFKFTPVAQTCQLLTAHQCQKSFI
jgi:hypothetical protein